MATQPLTVSHAFHSPLMEPMLQEFRRVAGQVAYRRPELPMIANVTGRLFGLGEVPDADYWTRHARQTVRYYAGWQTLLDQGLTVFVEIGPNSILTDLGRRYAAEAFRSGLQKPGRGQVPMTRVPPWIGER